MADCEHLKKPYIHDGCPACEITQLKVDLAELEGQLFESNRALIKAGIWQGESLKREAVLEGLLEESIEELETMTPEKGKNRLAARLRAALEVK